MKVRNAVTARSEQRKESKPRPSAAELARRGIRWCWDVLRLSVDWANTHAALLALLLGGPWAIYQFYYREMWLPSTRPVFAVVNASIECRSAQQGMVPVVARIDVENPGPRTANVYAAYYMVEGARVVRRALRDPEYREEVRRSFDSLDVAHRYIDTVRRQLVSNGRILNALGELVPGQRTHADIVTLVPQDSFDVVRVYAFVITQREYSQLAPVWEITGGGWVTQRPGWLAEWRGPGTGHYEVVPSNYPGLRSVGFNPCIARSEALVPHNDRR